MKAAKNVLKGFGNFTAGMESRKIATFAAAGAYYLFMSLVPLVMLLCAVLQYTPLTEEIALSVLAAYVPESMYMILARIVSTVYSGGKVALTVSLVLTVWSASSSMKAMMRGMDAVYDIERKESYFVFSLRACLYMMAFVLVFILSLIVMVYGGKILILIQNFLPQSDAVDYIFGIFKYLRFLVVMALLTLVFLLLYYWMPAVRPRFKHQHTGAVFAAVIWVMFSSAFSLYISMSKQLGAYGFIGTIMVAMIWMYYCLYFLLIGGYLNRYLYLRHKAGTSSEQK
jgi:membrane protein